MKIIISPTKTMKRKKYQVQSSQPFFENKAEVLRDILKGYSLDQIKKDFKTSDKLTNTVYNYFNEPKQKITAINLYEGLAFKNMDLEIFTKSDFDYLEKHVLILSAMYGALRPSDLILEYRLDYVMKFEIDLYDYWQKSLNDLIAKEDVIINLASQEFSKGIDHPNIINIHLLDELGRNLSTQAKMGRGDMVRYIVLNKISEPVLLKNYNNLGYKFIEEESDEFNYTFSKQ